jgi:DNA mismatch repair protein MSH5
MLRYSSGKSLLLIDEFGKGTDSLDGIALLCSAIKQLLQREQIPLTVLSTHFYEIFDLLKENRNLALLHMEFLSQSSDDVTFLYKLQAGSSRNSFGIHCAKQAGIRREILLRASQVAELLARGMPIPRINSEQSKSKETFYKRICDAFASLDCDSESQVTEFLSLLHES